MVVFGRSGVELGVDRAHLVAELRGLLLGPLVRLLGIFLADADLGELGREQLQLGAFGNAASFLGND